LEARGKVRALIILCQFAQREWESKKKKIALMSFKFTPPIGMCSVGVLTPRRNYVFASIIIII
jgi:hypothetical protein